MVYAAISGDFGEVSTITGVKHYKFSPAHGHWGFWCGDGCARKSLVHKDRVSRFYPKRMDIEVRE